MGIVCNEAESGVCCISLYYPTQSHLCSGGHGVCFIENDEFESTKWGRGGGARGDREYLFCRCESFDLFADDIDTSIVRSIEFEHHLSKVLQAINLSRQSEDGRCFARTGRAVEKEVRQTLERQSENPLLQERRRQTLCSINLLIVAKMSWCPETSSRVLGRYFSTLSLSSARETLFTF